MGVLYILQREVRSYFQSFIAYVVIAIFLVLAGYFFYTDLIMHVMWSLHKVDFNRIWEYYFNSDLRYVIMIVIPLLTMRLFAEEKSSAPSNCSGPIRSATGSCWPASMPLHWCCWSSCSGSRSPTRSSPGCSTISIWRRCLRDILAFCFSAVPASPAAFSSPH